MIPPSSLPTMSPSSHPFFFLSFLFQSSYCVISPSLGRAQKWTRQNRSLAVIELIFRETRLLSNITVYFEEWVCKTNVVVKSEVWIGGEAILRVIRESDLWEEWSENQTYEKRLATGGRETLKCKDLLQKERGQLRRWKGQMEKAHRDQREG